MRQCPDVNLYRCSVPERIYMCIYIKKCLSPSLSLYIYMHTYMRIPNSYVLSSAFCVLPTCSLHDRCHRDLEACGSHIVFNEQGMTYIGEGSLFMYKDGSDWIVTQGHNWSPHAVEPFWRCHCDPRHNGHWVEQREERTSVQTCACSCRHQRS